MSYAVSCSVQISMQHDISLHQRTTGRSRNTIGTDGGRVTEVVTGPKVADKIIHHDAGDVRQ